MDNEGPAQTDTSDSASPQETTLERSFTALSTVEFLQEGAQEHFKYSSDASSHYPVAAGGMSIVDLSI